MATDRIEAPSRAGLDDLQAPVVERVMANQFTLILGLIAALVMGIVGLLLTGIVPARRGPHPWLAWPLLALSVVVLLAALRQLLWPVALIEATTRGVRLKIRAPLSRRGLFFVPWSHVQAAVLTQVATSRGAREAALGLQIMQDKEIRLPSMRWNSAHAAPDAPNCNVVFAASVIKGDVVEWVRKIEGCRESARMGVRERVRT